MKKIILLISIFSCFVILSFTNLTAYESLSVSLFIYAIFSFVYDIGKKLAVLDVIILLAIFTCLVLPLTGYHYFTASNRLARLWFMYMMVPSDEYYSYMLPATITMIIGLKLPLFYRKQIFDNHIQYLINVKAYLADKKYAGLVLMAIGLISSVLASQLPAAAGQVFFLLKYLLFVGAFYYLYSDMPNKKLILVLVFSVLIARAITGGMFGEMVYMFALTFILLMLGNKMSYINKLTFFAAGVFMMLVLQAVKPSFRSQTWFGKNESNKVAIFAEIFQEKLTHPSSLFKDEKPLFQFYGRFNEGRIISQVLRSVPTRYPYAGGETIFSSLAASVVPRVLVARQA